MQMKRFGVVLALALPVAATGVEARVATPGSADFSGVWTHTGDSKEEEQRRKAIEAAIRDMPFFVRGTARDRLMQRTTSAPELKLSVEGDCLELSRGSDKITLRFGAEPVSIERDGRRGKMSARFDGQRIIVVSEGENGKRATTYSLSPDRQRLTLSVRMSGERLPEPLSFQATYQRKGGGPVVEDPKSPKEIDGSRAK